MYRPGPARVHGAAWHGHGGFDRGLSNSQIGGMGDLTEGAAVFTEVVVTVFRLNRLLLEAGDELTGAMGLTSARWQVLGVAEHGPVGVSEVARTMGLTRQSVQETANSLKAEGFIDLVDDPRDGRVKLIALTEKGVNAMEVVARLQAEWANRIAGGRSATALRAALAELRGLQEELATSGGSQR